MRLTPRLLIGERSGEFAVWLSAPGKDVLTASEDELLVSPDSQNLSFVANGVANLASLKTTQVLYDLDEDLSDAPVVISQFSYKNRGFVPQIQFREASLPNVIELPPRYVLTPSTDRMTIRSLIKRNIQVRYLIPATSKT